jgi:hypothetical protein
MAKFVALFLTAITFPIWGGAIAAVLGAGFVIATSHPWILILILCAPLALKMLA